MDDTFSGPAFQTKANLHHTPEYACMMAQLARDFELTSEAKAHLLQMAKAAAARGESAYAVAEAAVASADWRAGRIADKTAPASASKPTAPAVDHSTSTLTTLMSEAKLGNAAAKAELERRTKEARR